MSDVPDREVVQEGDIYTRTWWEAVAQQYQCDVQTIKNKWAEWMGDTGGTVPFADWPNGQRAPAPFDVDQGIIEKLDEIERRVEKIQVEQTPQGLFVVKNNTAPGRTLQQGLNVLANQPVGSAAETLIEAALKWSMVQRENALLRMENEDLKLRLRAAGVTLP